jgi:hypothetical protein
MALHSTAERADRRLSWQRLIDCFPYANIHFGASTFDWTQMAVDSIVAGFLALTMAASSVAAVRHAAERAGLSLLPNGRAV